MAEGLYGDLSVGLQIFAAHLQVELACSGHDVLPTLLHEGLHQQVRLLPRQVVGPQDASLLATRHLNKLDVTILSKIYHLFYKKKHSFAGCPLCGR
jgi:hypothetical protein